MKTWKISGFILLVMWLIFAALIWFRTVDGAGVVQSPRLKEITLLIWAICAIPVITVYIIWFIVLKKRK